MKKITVLTVFLVLLVFAVPTHPGKPEPKPNEVVVVNTDPIPIQGDVNVNNQVSVAGSVDITNTPDVNVVNDANNPVFVTMAARCDKTVVSGQVSATQPGEDYTALTVSIDKVFILTDIVAVYQNQWNSIDFLIKENSNNKLHVAFENLEGPYTRSLHLNSGVPFSPASNVNIRLVGGDGDIMVSGYEIDN